MKPARKPACDAVTADGRFTRRRVDRGHVFNRRPAPRSGGVRSGTMLHYVLLYMTICSTLLTTAGICLNTIMKSDAADRRQSQFLATLRRLDHRIREDAGSGAIQRISETEVVVNRDDRQIRWTAERGILNRVDQREDEVLHRERFIFPAGSSISFADRDAGRIVVVLSEPDPLKVHRQTGNGGSPASSNSVVSRSESASGRIEIDLWSRVP